MHAKLGEDLLTHLSYDLELWLEAEATIRSNRN